jgi:formamidopyrimidine-DNA glycosylase
MPELPEVETICRVMRHALEGRRIVRVEVVADRLVFSGKSVRDIEKALGDRVVDHVGRRGKTFWLALRGPGPTLFGHLGMSGWIREVGRPGTRLHSHGDAPLDDARGRPRFLRLWLETDDGNAIAFTDPRRLGRIWLGASPETERRIRKLGPDAYDALPSVDALRTLFATRKRPIKTVLLDQHVVAGIGNWIADEVLYQSRIAPARVASSLSRAEVVALRRAIHRVLSRAVSVSADHERFPKSWLFEHRWGGHRGSDQVAGQRIRRDVVGGRTTAWVPARQK